MFTDFPYLTFIVSIYTNIVIKRIIVKLSFLYFYDLCVEVGKFLCELIFLFLTINGYFFFNPFIIATWSRKPYNMTFDLMNSCRSNRQSLQYQRFTPTESKTKERKVLT